MQNLKSINELFAYFSSKQTSIELFLERITRGFKLEDPPSVRRAPLELLGLPTYKSDV